MRDNFIITVTNNIEGCPIEKYLDSICTNMVIGTNIFSDIAASFSDFFGGHSSSYKGKLELIYIASWVSGYEADKDKEMIAFIERYFTLLPKVDIIDKVYSRFIENSKRIGNLIKACHLFSPSHVLDIAKNNVHLAITLLDAKKDFYRKEGLNLMKQILNTFESLPDTGRIEMVKGGLLNKDQEKFICENGHKNSRDMQNIVNLAIKTLKDYIKMKWKQSIYSKTKWKYWLTS